MAKELTAKEITEIVDSGILDDEIIKALECCTSTAIGQCLKKCPYYNYSATCIKAMVNDALDLINRKDAEIERLENSLSIKCALDHRGCPHKKQVISKAIKEFAEKFKEKAGGIVTSWQGYEIYETKQYQISAINFDNLVKEMVGEKDV